MQCLFIKSSVVISRFSSPLINLIYFISKVLNFHILFLIYFKIFYANNSLTNCTIWGVPRGKSTRPAWVKFKPWNMWYNRLLDAKLLIYLSNYLTIHLSITIFSSIYLSIYNYFYFYLSIFISMYLLYYYLSIFISIYLYLFLSINLYFYLSILVSILYLSIFE